MSVACSFATAFVAQAVLSNGCCRYLTDHYRLGAVLGKGNFGTANLMRKADAGSLCVVKIQSCDTQGRADVAMEEALTLARIPTHARIVDVLHRGVFQMHLQGKQMVFISMEYCSGGNLRERISSRPLTSEELVKVFGAGAEADYILAKFEMLGCSAETHGHHC